MIRYFGIILLLVALVRPLAAQTIRQAPADTWKGFERVNFSIAGHNAYYVKPAKALAGNPWIWRASFPDWHTEMDSLLLVAGMYVVFISVDNEYGSPQAMQAWDQLYNYLTDSLSFAAKPSLEAVSRGGLYAYGWAKRNPARVSCIYAEAPVCDIKSWPGGKGKGMGDSSSWKQLQQVYSMDEKELMDFRDNPVDNLEGLAAYKVPVIHIISNDDKIVPVEENTYTLVERYTRLGGTAMVIPVTAGKQELYNHHFPIEHPQKLANLVLGFSANEKRESSGAFINPREGLGNSQTIFEKSKTATVAFLGGSITFNPGWRDKVCKYLRERFPQTQFHFIAAGISSLGSFPHAFRLQEDVLDSGIVDLLFVEAAVNDKANYTDSIQQVRSLEGIVRHVKRSNPAADIIMMSFADPYKTEEYDRGRIPREVANHELVADHYGLPSINLAKEVHDKLEKHVFSWEDDFKDLHPSVFGQELYFAAIKRLLQAYADKAPAARPIGQQVLPRPIDKANFDKGIHVPVNKAKFDTKWHLDENWSPKDSLPTRAGFVHRPVLAAVEPGAALAFHFKGRAAGMAIVSGPDAGMISYSIDGRDTKTIDLFTPWSQQLHLPWFVLFEGDLKPGRHTLKIKIANEKNSNSNGNACRVLYFLVNE